MPDLPLVSIVTCSYNNAPFILDTLESIKAQTYPNIELVIIDDCSTDNSVEIIDSWLKTYTGRYKFIKHDTNKGGSVPYNIGLANAKGKYYATVDSDDVIMPEKIERQVAILEATGTKIAAVYSNAYVMDVNGDPIDGLFIQRHRQFTEMPSGDIYERLLEGNYIPVMSLLIRREVFDELGGYDESLVYGDFDMWLRLARKYEFAYSDYVSGKYRIRPGSLSFTIRNWDYSNAKIFLKHIDAPLPLSWIGNVAFHAYSVNDHQTMPLIREIADRTQDRCLMCICLLWKFRVPAETGKTVLDSVKRHIEAGLSPTIVNVTESDTCIFLHEIAYSIPRDVLNAMAREAYSTDNKTTLLPVNALADLTNNRYLKTAYLLWRFKVSKAKGLMILEGIDGDLARATTTDAASVDDSDVSIFLNDIFPLVHPPLVRKIALEAYLDRIDDTILLLNELANKSGDSYLKTVYVLWKYHVNGKVGELILQMAADSKHIGKAAAGKKTARDDSAFFDDIISGLPAVLLKKLVFYAYADDRAELMSVIDKLARKTNDRYIMTVLLLWHFRISEVIGVEVLNKTEQKMISGLPDKIYADKANNVTGINVFLKEVLALLPDELQKKLTSEAYYNDNRVFISVIRELTRKTKNRYFKAVLLLWRYKVNAYTGRIILDRVDGYCKAKLSNAYIDLCIYKDIYGAFKTRNSSLLKMG